MTTSTTLVVREHPDAVAVRLAIAGFLAGYTNLTRASYTTDLRLFTVWCHEHQLQLLDVTRGHLELFARAMETEGKMRSTVARRLSTLCSFYRYCHVEGITAKNPAANVRRPKVDYESRTLGRDRNELGGLLVQAGLGSARDHALISLLAMNGLRISEALGADIEDLDTERGHRTLKILRKGGKHVTIPLAPRTARSLDLYVGERRSGPVFVGANGLRMDRYAADRTVKRLSRRAGIVKRISPRSLRHSFITAALDAGVPLRDVQEAASHADPRTTMRCDRARQSLDRHATYIVAAFVAGAARSNQDQACRRSLNAGRRHVAVAVMCAYEDVRLAQTDRLCIAPGVCGSRHTPRSRRPSRSGSDWVYEYHHQPALLNPSLAPDIARPLTADPQHFARYGAAIARGGALVTGVYTGDVGPSRAPSVRSWERREVGDRSEFPRQLCRRSAGGSEPETPTPLLRSGLPPVDDGLAAWLVDSAWRIDSSRLTTLIGRAMLCLNSLATAFKSCFALSAAVSVERGMATRAVRSAGP